LDLKGVLQHHLGLDDAAFQLLTHRIVEQCETYEKQNPVSTQASNADTEIDGAQLRRPQYDISVERVGRKYNVAILPRASDEHPIVSS